MKEVIKDLIAEGVKFSIKLISGKEITNIDKIDFNKYNNAFIFEKKIYTYSAIESIEIISTSILNVL